MSRERTFKLEELAAAAGVSGRTVRYYVQRGLLPPPAFRGRDTAYDQEHLLRLQAIRRMQEQYLPLDAIQAELARVSRPELEQLADGTRPAPLPAPMPMPRPLPPPYRAPSPGAGGEACTRWELAPGIELIAAGAALSDAVVDEIKAIIERQGAAGGRRR